MKLAISAGFVVAGLLVSSWVMDVYGTCRRLGGSGYSRHKLFFSDA